MGEEDKKEEEEEDDLGALAAPHKKSEAEKGEERVAEESEETGSVKDVDEDADVGGRGECAS